MFKISAREWNNILFCLLTVPVSVHGFVDAHVKFHATGRLAAIQSPYSFTYWSQVSVGSGQSMLFFQTPHISQVNRLQKMNFIF